MLQTESYGSVSVTWLDRAEARLLAGEIAKELAAAHPEIRAVLLFGSVARGDAVPGSDIDLLLILRDSDLSFFDRQSRYGTIPRLMDVNVFPYTEAELAGMKATGHMLLRAALAEGEWVMGSAPTFLS